MASEPITNFSSANGSMFTVDGYSAQAQNANQPWSLTQPDANTLQFSVQSGDRWSVGGYSDSGANRSEIQFSPLYAAGTQINMSETITIQPGPTNTASWVDLTQLHATTNVSPTYSPFVLGLDTSDRLQVILQNPSDGNLYVYRSPNPVVRGQPMDLDFQVKMGPSGGGYVGVWLDGNQIVDYHGAVGATNSEYYWKVGVYRGSAAETLTATFSNVDIWTGSAPAPTTPTQPTTPTSPITPPNLAPTVTEASASPGSGIADNGDTITMTLGFSEAVTVTGTPTLALNNGDTATYVGGSGTNSLTFKTTVAPTDKDTPALAVTGVNLPTGASIKDASGLAANLSGAVKTFAGLQVDATPTSPTSPTTPTAPTTPTTPSTPSVTTPVLTVADPTLSVPGRGGTVDLGVKVATTDPNDSVSLNIRGLARYETITDGHGDTFRGRNITLTQAQVDSGLTLHSYYRGSADPVDTISLRATARDPLTGAVTTSAPQRITVADAPSATAPTTTAPQTSTATAPAPATSISSPGSLAGRDSGWSPSATGTTTASPTGPRSALFNQFRDLVADRGVATSAPQTVNMTDRSPATSTTAASASLATRGFALLNQHMAANHGRGDPGQIVAATSNGTTWGQDSFLTRPQ